MFRSSCFVCAEVVLGLLVQEGVASGRVGPGMFRNTLQDNFFEADSLYLLQVQTAEAARRRR